MNISLFKGILLGIFIIAALLGLFMFATYNSTGTGSAAVGTVVIWGTLPATSMNAALGAMTKADPTLKGVSYVEKDPATLKTDLASAIATGGAPDLVLASQEDLGSVAKLVAPIALSANTFASSFVEEGGLFVAPAGAGYYGAPFLIDPLVLYANRAILSTAGIARPPATWEALTGLVPAVTTLTPARQITRSLIALGTYPNVHNARAILSMLFLQTGVPVSTRSSTGLLGANLGRSSASGGTPPGQAVLRFYTQFADPTKVSYTWNASLPDSQTAFLSGTTALYLGYASEASYLAAANPNLDFVVAPVPQPATATVKGTYGLVYALMIPRGAPNAAGASAAITLLTSAAEQAAAASATRLAPATLVSLSTVPAGQAGAVAYGEALYAQGWISPAPADTDSVFSSMISNVNSGRFQLDVALSTAESALSSLLQ